MATEKRLIDANAMRQHWLDNGENEYVYDTNSVLDSIDEQPTVDAVEVVHGRWMFRKNWDFFVCSECSYESSKYSHYCPNCGAKMDGDDQ